MTTSDSRRRDEPTHSNGTAAEAPAPEDEVTLVGKADATANPGVVARAAGETSLPEQLGEFRIEKRLGKGGMGEVFLATQVSLDRKVALKTLSRELADREDFVNRFHRECKAMGRLQHPNIVQVYSAAEHDGVHFVAIEFVDGQSLQDWMNDLGKLTVGDAVHVLIVCCEALGYAHGKQMIHRDVKPDNILITSEGMVKVADFGLAKALDDDQSMTQTGAGMGTPLYMAPEQARSAKHVDHRSDVFALGVMLYYLCTGQHPFSGDSLVEIIEAKERGKYVPPRQVEPGIPARLDLVIGRMIANQPSQRYGDYAELVADLTSVGVHNESLSFVAGAAKVAVRAGTSPTLSRTRRVDSPEATRKGASTAGDVRRKSKKKKKVDRAWLVKHTAKNGKVVISEMKTSQICDGLRNGFLDVKATAKKAKAKDAEFRPLAHYPEFRDLATQRVAEHREDVRREQMQNLYEEVTRDESWREFIRKVKNVFGGFTDTVVFLLYLALLAGVVYLLYLFAPAALDFVARKLNLVSG